MTPLTTEEALVILSALMILIIIVGGKLLSNLRKLWGDQPHRCDHNDPHCTRQSPCELCKWENML